MQRIIQTMALAAAFLTLCAGVWQGWAFVVTVKKILLAYMGVFFIGSMMVLAVRLAGAWESRPANRNGTGTKQADN